jgi:antitoxin (DNA-binding transcriptional repressor) of toxin-antitoxin stability system
MRKRIKHYFDVVESGEVVRVYRNGKPIAEILPVRNPKSRRKIEVLRFKIPGLSLSEEILRDRSESEL